MANELTNKKCQEAVSKLASTVKKVCCITGVYVAASLANAISTMIASYATEIEKKASDAMEGFCNKDSEA